MKKSTINIGSRQVFHGDFSLDSYLRDLEDRIDSGSGSGGGINPVSEIKQLVLDSGTGTLRCVLDLESLDDIEDGYIEVTTFTELKSRAVWSSGVPSQSNLGNVYDYILYENGGHVCLAVNILTHDEGDDVKADYYLRE